MNDDAPTLIYCNLFYITLPPHNPVYRDGYMGSGSGGVTLANMAKSPSYTCTTACKGGNHMQIPCLQHKVEDKREGHSYDLLSFKGNKHGQRNTTHDGKGDGADDVHVSIKGTIS